MNAADTSHMGTKMLNPTTSLLVKLGSIAVHADELLSPDAHPMDQVALKSLLGDPEIVEWLKRMDEAALLPRKRR